MTRCLLALGANLANRRESFDQTLHLLTQVPFLHLLARSTWHETIPVGGVSGQPNFLNGAVLVETAQSPRFVVQELQRIERLLGRERQTRWDARIIDIDLLLFGDEIMDTLELKIPHPRMSYRQFVLAPASEIAGEMVHPTSGWTVAALCNHWRSSPPKIAIASRDELLAQSLQKAILEQLCLPTSDLDESNRIELVSPDESPSMLIVIGNSDDLRHFSSKKLSGCVVQISTTDRATALQEGLAAVRAAWP